jgi:hypothetical protein
MITCLVSFVLVVFLHLFQWLAHEVPFNIVQPACDPELFAELSDHFVELQESTGDFQTADDLELVQSRRYAVDVVTFADAWVGCQNFVSALNAEDTIEVEFRESQTVWFSCVCLNVFLSFSSTLFNSVPHCV